MVRGPQLRGLKVQRCIPIALCNRIIQSQECFMMISLAAVSNHKLHVLRQCCAMQRDVLHLYRQVAREAKTKNAEERNTVMTYARGEFERCSCLSTPVSTKHGKAETCTAASACIGGLRMDISERKQRLLGWRAGTTMWTQRIIS